jgi:hypothetical protein
MAMLVLKTLLYGWCSQYHPLVMESVIRVRQAGLTQYNLPQHLPPVDGFVALKDCKYIGSIVWMRPLGDEQWESFLVVDCAGVEDGTKTWMEENNIIAEIDWETAQRWDTVGRGLNVEMMMLKYVPYTYN